MLSRRKPSHNIDEATITLAIGGSKEQTVSYVFVLDTTKRPLDPVHPGWARKLLSTGQAAVWRHYPFTKYHRVSRGLEKTHWLDAACVGKSTPECLQTRGVSPLHIKATGSGNRQLCGTDKYGFPIRHRARQKHVYEPSLCSCFMLRRCSIWGKSKTP